MLKCLAIVRVSHGEYGLLGMRGNGLFDIGMKGLGNSIYQSSVLVVVSV